MAVSAERVREISEAVYRLRLGAEGAARMDRNDAAGGMSFVSFPAGKPVTKRIPNQGQTLRSRAAAYDQLTRAYLEVLGITE